jgi:hypothetical protein
MVFAKTSTKRSFSMTEYERFGLFLRKRWSINSGTSDAGGGGVSFHLSGCHPPRSTCARAGFPKKNFNDDLCLSCLALLPKRQYAIAHNVQYQGRLPRNCNDSKDDRGGSHKEAKLCTCTVSRKTAAQPQRQQRRQRWKSQRNKIHRQAQIFHRFFTPWSSLWISRSPRFRVCNVKKILCRDPQSFAVVLFGSTRDTEGRRSEQRYSVKSDGWRGEGDGPE